MTDLNAAPTGRYVQAQPTHWFWNEDVPKGARFVSVEECQQLGIEPHENRLAGNDVPAVLFSTAYHLLEAAPSAQPSLTPSRESRPRK